MKHRWRANVTQTCWQLLKTASPNSAAKWICSGVPGFQVLVPASIQGKNLNSIQRKTVSSSLEAHH